MSAPRRLKSSGATVEAVPLPESITIFFVLEFARVFDQMFDVRGNDLMRGQGALSGDGRVPGRHFFHESAKLLDLVTVDRVFSHAGLESVVVARVVRARDHDAAVQVEVKDAEVSERRRADAEADDIEAALAHAADQRVRVAVAREPAVAAHGDGEALTGGHRRALGDVHRIGLAQAFGKLGREIAAGDAADVVLTKDGGKNL